MKIDSFSALSIVKPKIEWCCSRENNLISRSIDAILSFKSHPQSEWIENLGAYVKSPETS